MRPLITDKTIEAMCAEVVRYAAKHVRTIDDQLDQRNGHKPPAGDDPGHVIVIPVGYRCVFSISEVPSEKENQPIDQYRFLSISVDTISKLPSRPAVEEIIKLFGFKKGLEDCIIKFEDIAPGHQAIQILEKIKS